MRKIELSACLFLSLICGRAGSAASSAEPAGRPPDATVLNPLVSAALQQDWDRVLRWAEQHPAVLQYPVGRAVVAHACLAQNQNNRSFELFSSLKSAADLERYAKWTEGLVANGSPTRDHPVAHYFRGDALARHGDWPLAQRYFTKATQPDGHFALAWNALGVAHAYQDHFKDAKDCFKRATQEDGNLADAYANFGTLLLIIEAGPGAIENYRRALDESKEFALANNGRACVKLAYNRDKQSLNEAVADFNIALAKAETKALVESNMRRVLAASAGVSEEEIKPEALKGMTLHARDLVGLSPDVLDRQLGSMSSSQLRGLLHETNRHAGNVELGKFLFGGTDVRIGGELGAVGAFGPIGAFANLFGEGRQSMAGWEAHLDYRGGELRALRETIIDHMTPGGADTVAVALEQSGGDMGNWPTKDTRFGLVPLAKLPHVTKPGK